MKKILRIEEAAILAFSIFLFSQTNFAWWWYLILIFTPDIGMVGYLFGTKTGAVTYNIFHHKAVAIAVLCLGLYLKNEWATLAGIILLGHSGMDRMLGYGLKYGDSFHHTELGWIKPPVKHISPAPAAVQDTLDK